jgi:DNA invertase Pin-like site-specific DNA recombinase
MIAAGYARKSTDQTGVADDAKSVTRQIDNIRAYAAKKGWVVPDEYIFVDDGISGAEFANRPGFLRLMNALKPKAPFQVLVMSEIARLGREQIETAYALKQLSTAGVRCFGYLEDKEMLVHSATDKFLLSALTFGADLEREKARQRTYDAMLRKALAGHVTGGRLFGYDNVRINSHVERTVNEAEAAVVREIYERYARGDGYRGIAHALNARRIAKPRAQQGRPDGWSPGTIRAILERPDYRGETAWNRSRKRNSWGQRLLKRSERRREETDWHHMEMPHMRIISEKLAAAVDARRLSQRSQYLRSTKGQLMGRPPLGRYLLSGMLRCPCGSNFEVLRDR